MPARRYKFSTLVGCRHPVMARQASFSTGSTLCACADLSPHWEYIFSRGVAESYSCCPDDG